MEIFTINEYEWARDLERIFGFEENAIYYDGIIKKLEKKLPHHCGSEEFFLAPIVHIRCAKCYQPL